MEKMKINLLVLSFVLGYSQGFTAPASRSRRSKTLSITVAFHPRHQRSLDTHLAAISVNTVSAATGLVASSLLGIFSERQILPPNAGILGTLLASAVISNLGWAPTTHFLYDKCWSLVLPTSLAFLMLQKSPDTSSKRNPDIPQVGLAFLVASLASLLGSTLSFLICKMYPTLWFTPPDAAIAGGCLCASYIGGSVNFFATARLLMESSQQPLQQQRHTTALLSSMAAADLLVMAIYLAWLSMALQSRGLLRLFGEQKTVSGVVMSEKNKQVDLVGFRSMDTNSESTSRWSNVIATITVSLLACCMTMTANAFERLVSPVVSGTACAAIALLGTLVRRVVSSTLVPRRWSHQVQKAAEPLAKFSFQLFFSAVGMSANVGRALQTTGWSSLMFSTIAILTHISVTLGICRLLNSVLQHIPMWKEHGNDGGVLKLRHVLVASNAAIGGPATAAAYAGQQETGLAMAATVWGVVGYGIGTSIGIEASRWYRSML